MFLPVSLYLEAGVKIRIDRGAAYRLPYKRCFTNTCIAADLADPKLLKEMETGQKLLLEMVDTSVLTVSTFLPLNQLPRFGAGLRRRRLSRSSTSEALLVLYERPTIYARPADAFATGSIRDFAANGFVR